MSVYLGILACLLAGPFLVSAQHVFMPLGVIGPQAKTRDELDAFGEVYEAPDAETTVKRAAKFITNYPNSEFLEYAEVAAMHAYEELGNYTNAYSAARCALKDDPRNIEALIAIADLLSAGRLDTRGAPATLSIARQYGNRALQQLQAFTIRSSPTQRKRLKAKKALMASAYGILGRVAFQEQRHEEAVKDLRKAIELDPRGADFYLLGIVYAAQNRPKKATASFRQARLLGPASVAELALSKLADLSAKRKKPE